MVKSSKMAKLSKGLKIFGLLYIIETITNKDYSKADVLGAFFGLESGDSQMNKILDEVLKLYPELLIKETNLFMKETNTKLDSNNNPELT